MPRTIGLSALVSVLCAASGNNVAVVNTWFPDANSLAFSMLNNDYAALDSVQAGAAYCQEAQCDGSVGFGNHPDSTGHVTLDALIMNGETIDAAAVGAIAVRDAIGAARRVLDYTTETILVGEGATNFALAAGLPQQTMESNSSDADYKAWIANNCQPNFWNAAVVPKANTSCGPYDIPPLPSPTPMTPQQLAQSPSSRRRARPARKATRRDHDTIAMCSLDRAGQIAGAVSSNGADHKLQGRLGDAPIVGAALYADNQAGCAGATGDGDVTQRFLPAYQAVEFMRNGLSPQDACTKAVQRIMRIHGTSFQIGLVCMDTQGNVGAAAQGWTFTYVFASNIATNNKTMTVQVTPLPPLP
jgi:N4-(beta-N-acetylglucosaminyl)-L-asparaginase